MKNNPKDINILIACDNNYAPYYGVMLTSLFIHNSNSRFNVYWLTDKNVSHKQKENLYKLVTNYGSQLFVYEIDNAKLKDFPQSTHLNYAAYYNLNAANILPDTIHKIIYMDGDMVVNGDISSLWQLDLSDYACAMVEDCSMYDSSIYQRLGYLSKYGYYNNGVTVYNLDYLRKINFSEKALKFIEENPEKAIWMDQDAINVILAEKTLRLSLQYNFQTLFLLKYHWQHYMDDLKKQVLEASQSPIVIHYAGRVKPWNWRYYALPYKNEWDAAYKSYPCRCPQSFKPYGKYLKHLLKSLLCYNKYNEECRKGYISEAFN